MITFVIPSCSRFAVTSQLLQSGVFLRTSPYATLGIVSLRWLISAAIHTTNQEIGLLDIVPSVDHGRGVKHLHSSVPIDAGV